MRVLIVDDEKNIRELMGAYLKLDGIESDAAENGLSAQRLLREHPYDACLVDLRMPGMDGLTLIRWMRSEGFRMPIIMMSAHGEIRDAVVALKDGAQDYIEKPFDPEEMSIRLSKLIENQRLKNLVESARIGHTDADDDENFIGISPAMVRIRDIIERISRTPATVLITGESGTGKEVVARKIHSTSTRSEEPFVAINIGGVPEQLLESELFGYEKGAFTGAAGRKIGMFEVASGGTLFLDEIGEMPMVLQVKLLRVLQERKITRLGGTLPIPIDARIIAATNKQIEDQVRSGDFREDLFYRLNVVRIEIPPLRDRKEDIEVLAARILERMNRQMGLSVTGISADAHETLHAYSFPGNVRELENILERGVIFAESDQLQARDLELRGVVLHSIEEPTVSSSMLESANEESLSLKDVELRAIIRSLHRWEGNRTRAAEELGISRRTLINKISEYDLEL
jgi:two-component system, NtrC family, response regulator AtoC